jgi:hypothetical protein
MRKSPKPFANYRRPALSRVASIILCVLIVAAAIGGYSLGRLPAPASSLTASSTLVTTVVNSTTLSFTFYATATVVSVSTSVSTFSSTATVFLFPQNEVVTEEIIQVTTEFYPVIIAANCGTV